jgi:hypothetical protein
MAPRVSSPWGDACLGGLAAMQVPWGVAPKAPVQGMTRVAVGPTAKERAMLNDARWFAGIDWASQTHQVCLIDADGR